MQKVFNERVAVSLASNSFFIMNQAILCFLRCQRHRMFIESLPVQYYDPRGVE